MKAAVSTRYGPPEVVRLTEIPDPVCGAGELLVQVHASSVNRTDCGFRAAHPFFIRPVTGLVRPRLTVLGNEFAGVVKQIGAGVAGLEIGDRVFGYSRRFKAHAELLVVPAGGMVATIPDGLTFEQAAVASEGGHYALSCLRRAGAAAGQDWLVNGATGAIGSAAVQLLKAAGVRVTAVADTGNLALVEQLGADRVIDRCVTDVTTEAATYDVVFDAVGKSSFGRCRRLIRPGGWYLSTDLGPWSQNPLLAFVTRLGRGRRATVPLPVETQEVVLALRALLASGAFRPVIDRICPLEEIVAAYRYVETGRKVGNLVLRVREGDASSA